MITNKNIYGIAICYVSHSCLGLIAKTYAVKVDEISKQAVRKEFSFLDYKHKVIKHFLNNSFDASFS